MKNRFILMIAALVVVIALISACGSGNSAPTSAPIVPTNPPAPTATVLPPTSAPTAEPVTNLVKPQTSSDTAENVVTNPGVTLSDETLGTLDTSGLDQIGGNTLAPSALPTLPSQKGLGGEALPTIPAPPTQSPTDTAGSGLATLVYKDDFTTCDKMLVDDNETRSYACQDGAYIATLKQKAIRIPIVEGTYDNDIFIVDARITSNSNYGEFGLAFRINNNGADGYGAGILNGKYTIWRSDNGQFTDLVPYTDSDKLSTGFGNNTIQVATYGNQIALFLNGNYITTVVDDTYASGSAGLYLAGSDPPLQVAFDNFGIAKFNQPVNLLSQNAPNQPSQPSQANQPPPPTNTPAPTKAPATGAGGVVNNNPCKLGANEAGLLISNSYPAQMRFTIGGEAWGTHDYDIPGDGKIYIIAFPPGRYTYSASIPGFGTDHGEPYDYKLGTCRQIDYSQ